MRIRILTVSGIYNYKKQVPLIRIQGKWLERLGFNIGRKIEVSYCEGIIVIKLFSSSNSEESMQQENESREQDER